MPRLPALRLACLLLVVAACPGPAHAGPAEGRARDLFQRGQVAFEAGRFAEAAHLFEDAYALSRRAALLWNIGRAYQSLFDINHNPADLRQARAVFLNYSELARTGPERDDAVRQLARIDARLATLDEEKKAERERLDLELRREQERLKQEPSPPRPSAVEPAPPLPSPPPAAATATPAAAPAAAPPSAPAPSRPSLAAPVALAVLAVALAGTGAGIYAWAQGDYNAVVPGCTPRCAPSQFDPIANRFYASYGLLGAAGALAIVDVALWAVRGARRPEASSRAARRLTVLPTLGGMAVEGSF